ncbi:aldo/keto reductase [Actinacidiphila oryziradicis]|nr:aldo/keto reductase [Actinacidiphila oryziradicis]
MTRLGPDLEVPPLGLGAMVLSGVYGEIAEQQAEEVIRAALDGGAGFIDTSDAYGRRPGENEELIGRTVAGRRDEVVIATKFGYVGPDQGRPVDAGYRMRPFVDGSPAHVAEAIDASLRRLGTDHVDLWYLHFPDPEVPVEETVGAMAEQVAAGKVRHIGLSNVDAAQLRKAATVHPVAAVQFEYSLFSRQAEAALVPACDELGVGFVAWGPLGSGFLADPRYLDGSAEVAEVPRGDLRSRYPRFCAETLAVNRDRFAPLRDIARDKGCTPGRLALAWLLARGAVPIPGTRNPAHLTENLAAAEVRLSVEEIAELDRRFPADTAAGATFLPG